MTNPQAWKGDYTQLRFYPSRGVCAVTVEIPLEEGTAFVAAFGTPLPKSGIPIALARIDPNAKPVEDKLKGGPLCKRAAILCSEGAFVKFLNEKFPEVIRGNLEDGPWEPADLVRQLCGIESRRELDHDPGAARKFLDLVAEYEAWKLI